MGSPLKAAPGSYWLLKQVWSRSQSITLDVNMPVRVINGEGENAGKVALVRGPLVLAADERFNPVVNPVSVVSPVGRQPQLKVVIGVVDADRQPVYETEGIVTHDINGHRLGDRVPLRLSAFASAGADGTRYSVWLPRPAVGTP
jgi:DUF1680 family protein